MERAEETPGRKNDKEFGGIWRRKIPQEVIERGRERVVGIMVFATFPTLRHDFMFFFLLFHFSILPHTLLGSQNRQETSACTVNEGRLDVSARALFLDLFDMLFSFFKFFSSTGHAQTCYILRTHLESFYYFECVDIADID